MFGKAILAGLFAIGIAVLSGVISYNAGFAHGLAATGGAAATGPYGPYHYGFFPWFGFGFFFPVLFFFLILSFISKLFFWGRWRRHGYWERRWHDGPDERPRGEGGSPSAAV